MRSRLAPYPVTPLVLAILLLLLEALLPGSRVRAQSADPCFEWDDLVVESGDRLECDLFMLRGSLYLEEDAAIDGSVNVLLGSARIDGLVEGDIWVGRDLEVGGEVRGSAAAAGGRIAIDGRIGKDVAAIVGDVDLAEGGRVEGGLTAAGDIRLAGAVGGDVNAGGDLEMLGSSRIGGAATVAGEITRSSAARIDQGAEAQGSGGGLLSQLTWALAMIVFAAIFGALAVNLLPDRIARVRDAAAASTLMTTFLGLLALVALPFLSLLILPIFIYIAALGLGVAGAGEHLATRLLSEAGRGKRAALGSGVLAALFGLALLLTRPDLPMLPYLVYLCGAALMLALLVAWPLGAGLSTLLGARPWPRSAGVPSAGPGHGLEPLEPAVGDGAARSSEGAKAADGEPAGVRSSRPSDAQPMVVEPPDDPAEADDGTALRGIPGITPIYAVLLAESGIISIEQLAETEPETLVQRVSAPGVMPIDAGVAASWIQTAREMLRRA